jgi:hypothetical protein
MIRFRSGDEWEGLDGMMDETIEELRPKAALAMKRSVLRFESELKKTLTGKRSGRTYRVSRAGNLHVASAPGEPPAVLFGALRNSVGHTEPKWRDRTTIEAEVGTGLGVTSGGQESPAYARRLEYGGADSRGVIIWARPYMAPTAERVDPIIEEILERAL